MLGSGSGSIGCLTGEDCQGILVVNSDNAGRTKEIGHVSIGWWWYKSPLFGGGILVVASTRDIVAQWVGMGRGCGHCVDLFGGVQQPRRRLLKMFLSVSLYRGQKGVHCKGSGLCIIPILKIKQELVSIVRIEFSSLLN